MARISNKALNYASGKGDCNTTMGIFYQIQEVLNTLSRCDLILSPAAATEKQFTDSIPTTPLDVYRQDAFTVTANLSGLPAISLPVGDKAVQLMGNRFSERLLYTAGELLTREVQI